mmetsp:Transcript_64207/g.113964  ORF Transcript_64207/g.113964 Transcript_64207/m.113964 type:complete len:366 (-) Transcript_64207:128-1225(-)
MWPGRLSRLAYAALTSSVLQCVAALGRNRMERIQQELQVEQVRSLWPFAETLILTAPELEPTGRAENLRRQLQQMSFDHHQVNGDYALRYNSLAAQFEELKLDAETRNAWLQGRAQNQMLQDELIGNAEVFCDVPACLQQSKCICVDDATALPPDSLLSILTTHQRAWQAIADADSDDKSWHLVLEDDAQFLPGISAQYFQTFQVPSDADLVWLYGGHFKQRCWAKRDEENVLMSGPVYDATDYNGVAYAITKAAARQLLQHLPLDGRPVDMAMNQVVIGCWLKAFCPPAGRYPVSDSIFQSKTTRLALDRQNYDLDEVPSFLQVTSKGYLSHTAPANASLSSADLQVRHQVQLASEMPRRRVNC